MVAAPARQARVAVVEFASRRMRPFRRGPTMGSVGSGRFCRSRIKKTGLSSRYYYGRSRVGSGRRRHKSDWSSEHLMSRMQLGGVLSIAQQFHVTQCFGVMSHCHLFCILTLYLILSHVLDFGGTLLGMSSGRLARCMVGIVRGGERGCSWPARIPPAELRGVCMRAGSGGVCGC